MPKTIQQAAQDAIAVQDACNLSGVVGSFHDILHNTLWPEARKLGHGTAWVNRHPISQLFADKIASLTEMQYDSIERFATALETCTNIAIAVPSPGEPDAR